MATRDPFAVLLIDKTASAQDIRRAWRERARTVHPDVGGSDAAMQELNEALRIALELVGVTKVSKAVSLSLKAHQSSCRSRITA